MAIGILYESREWSTYRLQQEIQALGEKAMLIDLEEKYKDENVLKCDLLVNRIFASAYLRGHKRSVRRMTKVIRMAKEHGIPMINSYEAHDYEMNKEFCAAVLRKHGFPVPEVYGVFFPKDVEKVKVEKYPCILKPNCGGRAEETYIVSNESMLFGSMKLAPNIEFILEEYIPPAYGYVTRIEVIDGICRFVGKRKAIHNKHTCNHLDSAYLQYEDCDEALKETAIKALGLLKIQCGSAVIIEKEKGFSIININSVSNASESMTEELPFDLIKETAAYIVAEHRKIQNN